MRVDVVSDWLVLSANETLSEAVEVAEDSDSEDEANPDEASEVIPERLVVPVDDTLSEFVEDEVAVEIVETVLTVEVALADATCDKVEDSIEVLAVTTVGNDEDPERDCSLASAEEGSTEETVVTGRLAVLVAASTVGLVVNV